MSTLPVRHTIGLDHDDDHCMNYESDSVPLRGGFDQKVANPGLIAVRQELLEYLDWRAIHNRERFLCAFICNAVAFLVTAILPICRKSWLPAADSSQVITLRGFRWVKAFSTILSQGVPRAAWTTLGDTAMRSHTERVRLSYTLILFQAAVGIAVTFCLSFYAESWVASNLTPENAEQTIQYVTLSIYSTLPSAVEAAVAVCARALDRPDVSVVISGVNFFLNLAICTYLKTYHDAEQWGRADLITTHERVALAGDTLSVLGGFIFFLLTVTSRSPQHGQGKRLRPSLKALWVLLVPGSKSLLEVSVRTLFGLAAESAIGPMRILHNQAYLIHNELRWTLMMVHAHAFEATALTFMSHNWSQFRATFGGTDATFVRTTTFRIGLLLVPVCIAMIGTLSVEVTSTIFMAAKGVGDYAWTWATHTSDVSEMAARMWRSWSVMYVFHVTGLQVAVILLVSKPGWWLGAGLATQILYILPSILTDWTMDIREDHVWEHYGSVFVGSLVFWFFCVLGTVGLWLWCLKTGWRGWLRFDTFMKA